MQCAAPNLNKRCLNLVSLNSKYHCSQHQAKSRKLYLLYKKICKIAESLDVKDYKDLPSFDAKMKFLNRCYLVYKRAYDARLDHRKFSFVSYFYDDGHDHQMYILRKEYMRCEKYIINLCKTNRTNTEQEQVENTQMTNTTYLIEHENLVNASLDKVKSFQKLRLEDEANLQADMLAYQEEYKAEKINQSQCLVALQDILLKCTRSENSLSNLSYSVLLQAYIKWQKSTKSTCSSMLSKYIILPQKKRKMIETLCSFELRFYTDQLNQTWKQFAKVCKDWQLPEPSSDYVPLLEIVQKPYVHLKLVNDIPPNNQIMYGQITKNDFGKVASCLPFVSKLKMHNIDFLSTTELIPVMFPHLSQREKQSMLKKVIQQNMQRAKKIKSQVIRHC